MIDLFDGIDNVRPEYCMLNVIYTCRWCSGGC